MKTKDEIFYFETVFMQSTKDNHLENFKGQVALKYI